MHTGGTVRGRFTQPPVLTLIHAEAGASSLPLGGCVRVHSVHQPRSFTSSSVNGHLVASTFWLL